MATVIHLLPRFAARHPAAPLPDHSDAPPHTAICWPVMAPASDESRNATSAATSSGATKRPIGGRRGADCARAGSRNMGVSVAPGATTFTVIPRGASSLAHERARPTSAALLAAYWLRPAAPAATRLPTRT